MADRQRESKPHTRDVPEARAERTRREDDTEISPEEAAVLDLQRAAGNKAVTSILGTTTHAAAVSTPAIRFRDSLRSSRVPPVQRELALDVQRANKGVGKRSSGPRPATTLRTLRLGSRGPDVEFLQADLDIEVDGIFGGDTHAAVVAFQGAHGLNPDGIVGPKTWEAIGASTPAGSFSSQEKHVSSTGEGDKWTTGSEFEVPGSEGKEMGEASEGSKWYQAPQSWEEEGKGG
jgi:peptidoglycan hydrolase-like protein with peptidoglycan-binding domain